LKFQNGALFEGLVGRDLKTSGGEIAQRGLGAQGSVPDVGFKFLKVEYLELNGKA
jgi:hypothetical protein